MPHVVSVSDSNITAKHITLCHLTVVSRNSRYAPQPRWEQLQRQEERLIQTCVHMHVSMGLILQLCPIPLSPPGTIQ